MPESTLACTARIALVGDRSVAVRAHTRIPSVLEALRQHDRLDLDAYWIPTEDAVVPHSLDGFDGIWLVPGSPYRSEQGALAAVRVARENDIPFLGTCGGSQHAMLEFARDVCGFTEVAHGENTPSANDLLISPLTCSLIGHEAAVNVVPGSLAERALGTNRTVERYHCSYGLNPAYLKTLREHGMRFTGTDDAGDMRVAELPTHPFFMATLFQPELAGDTTRAHPIIRAFATAVATRASTDQRHGRSFTRIGSDHAQVR